MFNIKVSSTGPVRNSLPFSADNFVIRLKSLNL